MLTQLNAFTAPVSAEGLAEAVCNRTSHMRRAVANIVSGKDHPALKEWKQGEPDLGLVFATGILS